MSVDPSIDGIINTLMIQLSPLLQEMGFRMKKRSFNKKRKECTQELNFQLRMIKGQEAGYLALFPNILFENVGRMAAHLRNESYRRGWPTAAANIGNLQKDREYLEIPLVPTSDIQGLTHLLQEQIVNIAQPFWEDYITLEDLIMGYENGDPRLTMGGNSYVWNFIAAYCLIQQYDKAIEIMENWEKGRPSDELRGIALAKINELRGGGDHDF